MVKYENGNKFIFWFAGTIVTILLFMGSQVIATDQNSRSRDDVLKEKLVIMCDKQQECNQDILVALADIKGDIKVIKKEMVKNGSNQ